MRIYTYLVERNGKVVEAIRTHMHIVVMVRVQSLILSELDKIKGLSN